MTEEAKRLIDRLPNWLKVFLMLFGAVSAAFGAGWAGNEVWREQRAIPGELQSVEALAATLDTTLALHIESQADVDRQQNRRIGDLEGQDSVTLDVLARLICHLDRRDKGLNTFPCQRATWDSYIEASG